MSPPELKVLRWAQDLTTDELRLLWKLAKQFGDGSTIESYIHDRDSGLLQIWRVEGGLVLTQTVRQGDGSQLVVYGVAGCGILRVLEDSCEDLKVIAKTFECGSIGGNVFRKGLEKLYQQLGAKPVSTYYELEL